MQLHLTYYLIIGILILILLFLYKSYKNYMKKYSDFPFFHILPYLVYCQLTGRVSEDNPLNNVFFQKLIEIGKECSKEGQFMVFLFRPILLIFNEEAIKIFATEKAALDKSPEYDSFKDISGEGVGLRNGEDWRIHRKLLNPAFQVRAIKENVALFNQHAMAFTKDMEKMAGLPSVQILDILKYHYFKAAIESLFGIKQNEENEAEIQNFCKLFDSLSAMSVKRFIYPWLRWKFLSKFLSFGRMLDEQLKECTIFIDKVIAEVKTQVYSRKNMDVKFSSNYSEKSLMYILLNQHLNDPSFTYEDIRSEMKTILIATYDTVLHTTLWCLYLLGLHPEIQDKVYNEVSTLDDNVTYEESCTLTYLESVILETLRLYPPLPLFTRKLSEDVCYGTYKVPKDTVIAFFPYLSHRNPEIFPNPDEFDPDRFLNAKTKKIWSFLPFSEGIRNCIGKKYAITMMKIFLAHVLKNIEINSLDRRDDIELHWNIILSPSKHLSMKLSRRIKT